MPPRRRVAPGIRALIPEKLRQQLADIVITHTLPRSRKGFYLREAL